jgi:hypothetical protein
VDVGEEDRVISRKAASSTPIRSLRFCTTCKLLLPLLLLLLELSFTSVFASPLFCCCCCLWSRPSSCLLFFRYRIPQALQSDCQQNWNELRKKKTAFDLFSGHSQIKHQVFFSKQFSWLFYYPKKSVSLVRNSGQLKHIEKVEDRNEKLSNY